MANECYFMGSFFHPLCPTFTLVSTPITRYERKDRKGKRSLNKVRVEKWAKLSLNCFLLLSPLGLSLIFPSRISNLLLLFLLYTGPRTTNNQPTTHLLPRALGFTYPLSSPQISKYRTIAETTCNWQYHS